MAGVEVVKTTISNVAHQTAHYDDEKRAKETTHHKNKHIDKSKSHLNYCVGASSWREIMNKSRDLVKKVDKEKPPVRIKKDRKTMCYFDIWCPNDIKDDKAFFEKVFAKLDEAYPHSFMGIQVHVDEQHEYVDPRTKEVRMSMKHGHTFIVPNHSEKGINMKTYLDRNWYKKVNAICEEVAKEFGAKYHTGEGYIDYYEGKTQEQLKMESAKAAIELGKDVKNREEKIASLENNIDQRREENITLQIANDELQEENATLQTKCTSLQEKSSFLERQVTQKQSKLDELREAIEGLKEEMEKFISLCEERLQSIEKQIKKGRPIQIVERVFGKTTKKIEEGRSIYDRAIKQPQALQGEEETISEYLSKKYDLGHKNKEIEVALKEANEQFEETIEDFLDR